MKQTHLYKRFCLTTHSKCVACSDDALAVQMLKNKGFSIMDAARLCIALTEAAGMVSGENSLPHLHRFIVDAAEWQKGLQATVSFKEALQTTLEHKKHRSPRTLQDIRQTMNALMNSDDGLADTPLRKLSSARCLRLLEGAFKHSPSRFNKARANLSGVFSVSLQHGWCSENPILRIRPKPVQEKTITVLNIEQIKSLFTIAQEPEHRACLPALALMLYAGVRPDEVRRLSWSNIDWEEKVLHLQARHSKTGGARHVMLAAPLMRMLREDKELIECASPICPSNWRARWRSLREAAGFTQWVPDVLRHSFASYHAKRYRDLPLLQLSMGHRDCRLLLTRYINMSGISKKDAIQFWQG